jgi:hypothetical protein
MHIYTKRRKLFSMIEEKLRKSCNNDRLIHAFVIYDFEDTEKIQLTLKFTENRRVEYNFFL